MPILDTCKFDDDPIKNEGTVISTTFREKFGAQGQVMPKQEVQYSTKSK